MLCFDIILIELLFITQRLTDMAWCRICFRFLNMADVISEISDNIA